MTGKRKTTHRCGKNKMKAWHLDKTIPISLIGAILFQTMCIVWWASTVESRLIEAERRIIVVESNIEARTQDYTVMAERLARVEEQSRTQLIFLQRIDSRMDRSNNNHQTNP